MTIQPDYVITQHIKRMTKEEKWEELREYYRAVGVLNLDIDAIKWDQAVLGAPDSALDDALLRCATLGGSTLGTRPLTATELGKAINAYARHLDESRRALNNYIGNRGLATAAESHSLRRSAARFNKSK